VAVVEPGPEQELKVAIVGKAPSSMLLAPYADESWQIWSLGDGQYTKALPRWSVWFELHELNDGKTRWAKEYWDWLSTDHGKPVYVQGGHPDLPHATPYPIREIVEEFGTYFTSSIAWMIALAIRQGAKQIGLWGVDMATDTEYAHQRACCEFMLGVAFGRGIDVLVPDQSPLCKTIGMYAFDPTWKRHRKVLETRKQEIQKLKAEADGLFSASQVAKWKLQGMLDENERMWQ
jgi:hypothetical protein